MIDPTKPAPPVAPDLDLSGFAWVPLDTATVLAFIEKAPPEAVKAALALWCQSWRNIPASSIPGDEKRIAAGLGLPMQKWRAIRDHVMTDFVLCADGRYYHTRIAEQAIIAAEKSQKQRNRAGKRWLPQGALDLVDKPVDSDATAGATANAINRSGLVRFSVDEILQLPNWIAREAWDGFTAMRTLIKAPLTYGAAKRTVDDLDALRLSGHDPNACLRQSEQMSYRGVFAPRATGQAGKRLDGGKQAGIESRNEDVASNFAKGLK